MKRVRKVLEKVRRIRNPGQVVRTAKNRVVEEAEDAARMEHPDRSRLSAALHDLLIARLGTVTATLPGMRRREKECEKP